MRKNSLAKNRDERGRNKQLKRMINFDLKILCYPDRTNREVWHMWQKTSGGIRPNLWLFVLILPEA